MSENNTQPNDSGSGQGNSSGRRIPFSVYRGPLVFGLGLLGLACVSLYFLWPGAAYSERVVAIIDRATLATKAYVKEHHDLLISGTRNIGGLFQDLSEKDLPAREELDQQLMEYAFRYRLAGVFITNGRGKVLGGSDPEVNEIPVSPDVERLKQGDPIVFVSDRQLAAVMKLPGSRDVFLFATRNLNPELLEVFGETKQFIHKIERSKSRLQKRRLLFVVGYGGIAGIILIISVTWGVRAANLAAPK
ncbi:MAG: hypothetical protein ACLFWF_04610 [Alphaproteobacteria bacterium]